jgi:hypothetical protein
MKISAGKILIIYVSLLAEGIYRKYVEINCLKAKCGVYVGYHLLQHPVTAFFSRTVYLHVSEEFHNKRRLFTYAVLTSRSL